MATPYRGPQFGLLPTKRMSWQTLATSYGIELAFLLLLVNLGLLFPEKLQVKTSYHLTQLMPLPGHEPKPLPKPKPQMVRAKLLPPAPIATPHLIVPREVRAVQPPRPAPEPEAPKVVVNNFQAPQLKTVSGGARPQLIHTGDFSSGSSATPTLNVPAQKVQTGGFGDPNGLKGEGKPGAHLVAASTGSFDMPQGPGYGNGTGGAKGMKGTVASAGFGNGVAVGGNGDGRSNGRGNAVATGAFGQQELSHGTPKPQLGDSGPPTNAVEITYKPNPVYTDEARQLRLEGEVLLEVMFGANGQLQVNRLVRGLGHGLDEAAIAAANKMRFKPALRNGQPVDSTAIVHVKFQLAY